MRKSGLKRAYQFKTRVVTGFKNSFGLKEMRSPIKLVDEETEEVCKQLCPNSIEIEKTKICVRKSRKHEKNLRGALFNASPRNTEEAALDCVARKTEADEGSNFDIQEFFFKSVENAENLRKDAATQSTLYEACNEQLIGSFPEKVQK